MLERGKRISEFIIDGTLVKIGSTYMRIWVSIEPKNKQILTVTISKERTMLIAERFILSLINRYGNHQVSTDGGTWYPQACKFLNIDHPYPFLFGEKPERENDAIVHQGQN
jgi:putative transposase